MGGMSPAALERDWLSLRYWLHSCVLPSAAVLLIILLALKLMDNTARELDHKAVIVGFFTLYFILVRGGHILMTRSLHMELLKKYEAAYRESLAQLDSKAMKKRNIGFTLARIKRDLALKKEICKKETRQNEN